MLGCSRVAFLGANYPWYQDTSGTNKSVSFGGIGFVSQSNEGNGLACASFSGYNYLIIPGSDFAFGTTAFTWECFVKSGNNSIWSGYNWIFGTQNNNGAFYREKDSSGNTLVFGGLNNSSSYVQVAGSTATDFTAKWYHIAASYDGTTLKLFIDGVLYASGSIASINYGNPLWIGTHYNLGGYVGKMAGVRIVKGSALYTSSFTVPTSLLTAVNGTKLLLNFGSNAVPNTIPWYADTSSSRRAITLAGSVTQSDEGGGVKAAVFNGSNSTYLSFASSDFAFSTTAFTWECFVKAGDTANNWFFGTPNNVGSFDRDSGVLSFLAKNNGGSYISLSGASVTFTAKWYHIAACYDGTTLRLFKDGVLYASNSQGSINYGSTTWVGAHYNLGGYNGKIAGIRVVKGTALYTSNFTVPTTLLTAVSGTILLMNFEATAVPSV